MKPLYLLFLGAVLCAAGCAQDRSNPPSSNTADTSSSVVDTAKAGTESPNAQSPSAQRSAPSSSVESSVDTSAAVHVLVLGNSIAAGYGLPRPTEQSFPERLQQRVDSLGWDVHIQNAGLSGETTAGGLRRIGWLLRQPVDVLVLELGGNDGLRGVDLASTRENLNAMIDTTLSHSPNAHVLLASVPLPPNLGSDYTEQFRTLYAEIASQREPVDLVRLVPDGLGSVDPYMQNDGIHPNVAGHRYVAQNVWDRLRPLLQQMRPT